MKNSKIYPWLVVGMLCVVALLNYLDRQMLSTMQANMAEDFSELKNAEMFGALMAAFMWVYAFVSPIAGMVADRVSRKWLIIGSLFVWSAVTFLMGFAASFDQLKVLRAIMGISEALYIPSALSLIADWHKDGKRSLAVGLHTTGLYLGSALGGFGAMVASEYSWKMTFESLGLFGMVYAVVLIVFLYEKRDKTEMKPAEIASQSSDNKVGILGALSVIFSTMAFWVILFVFAIPSLPGWATKNWLPTLFVDSLHLDMSVVGPVATISLAVSSFLGAFIGGWLSDSWVKKNIRGRIFTSAIGLSLTLPGLILLGYGNGFVAVVGAVLLFGIGFGMFDANNMPILCQFVASKYRATAYGIMNMTGVLFGAVATQLMGSLPSIGFGFACMSGAVAIAILLQLLFLKPKTDNMI